MTDETPTVEPVAPGAEPAASAGTSLPAGDGGGAGAPDPRAYLPEDLRSHPLAEKYKSKDDWFRALVAAQPLLGAQKGETIVKPKDGDPEDFRRVLTELGLPAAEADYTITGATKDPTSDTFKAAAFKAGVLPAQAEVLYKEMAEHFKTVEAEEAKAQTAKEDANLAHLQQTLGAAYGETVKKADIVSEKFGLTKVLNDANLGTEPAVINFLAKAYALIAEDSPGGRALATGQGGAMSPAQHHAEADRLTQLAIDAKDPTSKRRYAEQAFQARQLANA